MAVTIYAGPGKLNFNGQGIFPEGENGQVKLAVNQESEQIFSGYHGRLGEQQANAEGKITIKPIDRWSYLATFFPPYLGAKVGATAAALAIGSQPHTAANVPAKVWTPDGRLYTGVRAGIIKPPTMNLGPGLGLYDEIELSLLGDLAKKIGQAGFLYTLSTAQADPGGLMAMDDFVRGAWYGVWGDAAGFGGDQNGTPMEAEDGWKVTVDVKYQAYPVQKVNKAYGLVSVGYMVSGRLFGPTHAQIDAAIGIHGGTELGDIFGSDDLVLTGPLAKTITLKNCAPKGAGFEFGGTKLGTGEVGFVNRMTFNAGAPEALIEFSA